MQGVFNTAVTKQTSVWVAAGWVQLSAFAVCVLLWLFTGREPVSGLMEVSPRYVLLGGVIGALITYTVIRSMGSLGPAGAALLIVVAPVSHTHLPLPTTAAASISAVAVPFHVIHVRPDCDFAVDTLI